MEEVKEECGVCAIYLKNPLKSEILPELQYHMMSQLQHRGQLSAGISVFNPLETGKGKRLKLIKEIGKVNDLFKVNSEQENEKINQYLRGIASISHLRYATSGTAKNELIQIEESQPFLREHGRPYKEFTIAFNGNLANYEQLKTEMEKEGYHLNTEVDTEIIMHLISLNLNKYSISYEGNPIEPDFFKVTKEVMEKLDGSYSLVALFSSGHLLVFRDPHGIRPLVYGENEDYFAVASESVALEKIGIKNFNSVEPGSCLLYKNNELKIQNLISNKRKAHCHFERVYFSRADSIIDNKSVNSTREALGENLAEIEPLKNQIKETPEQYIVVPVPNTAIPAAEAYARSFKLNISLAITRNDIERGFINKEKKRKVIMDRKYGIISERIIGKKVILFDDSIVRGETSKKIIKLVKDAGACEVHLRSTEPPLKFPCFYGVDFPTYTELIAFKFQNQDIEEMQKNIAQEIGADSVVYQTISGLIKATGFQENELCLACLNGDYVTSAGKQKSENLKQ